FIASGWSASGLPAGALGFVLLPALAGVVVASMVTAPFGARLAHRLPVATLRRVFAVVLYLLAAKMVVSYA
ncbi:MAG: TSUP family transporter, partial [Dolichospermum sp.]